MADPWDGLALCQVVSVDDGRAPEWIPLIPAGAQITALDGRKFGNPKPELIVKAFNDDPRDVPVDFEHSTEIKAPVGEPAPAAGWIVAMEVRKGAVWGKVEWTESGKAALESREYRYISPAFAFNNAKKMILEVVSAALVNRPAFNMPAVARSQKQKGNARQENSMDKKLLKLLGLKDDATQEEIDTALASYMEKSGELAEKLKVAQAKLDEDPAADLAAAKKEVDELKAKVKTTETELANAREANPSLDKFVPRAEFDAAKARAKAAEEKIATADKTAHEKAVEGEIDAALKAGKIVPASKDFYVKTCSTEEGLAQFREFVKTAPKIGEPSDLDDTPVPQGDGVKPTDAETAIARQCGISPEAYAAAKKDDEEYFEKQAKAD